MDDNENKLYTDFSGSNVLTGITADNFDDLKKLGFINPKNKDFFDDLLRVGYLSSQISSSGPIPATAKIHDLYSGGSSNPFTPGDGEVWFLSGGSVKSVSSSAGRAFILIDDGTINDFEIADESWSAGQQNPWDPFIGGAGLYLDANTTLKASVTFTSGSTAAIYSYLIRVR